MRIITFFCFLSLNTLGQSLDVDQVRDLFVNADKKKETCSKLLDLTDDFKENSYLAEAYNATAKMISSKHIINPYSNYKVGDAIINLNKMTISLNKKNNKINSSERKILIEMLSNPGKTYSREEIGSISGIIQERSIDVMITRLRQKLEIKPKNPKYLQTIRGLGYVLWIE